MKRNIRWVTAVAVAVVFTAVLIIAVVTKTSKDIPLNDAQLGSLEKKLDNDSDETAYNTHHIKYYGSRWADCSTRLFIVSTGNEFFKDESRQGFHYSEGRSNVMIVDAVIDGDDLKIKKFDILIDLGFEGPESELKAKIPERIYSSMKLENPDKYIEQDIQKARLYFKSQK